MSLLYQITLGKPPSRAKHHQAPVATASDSSGSTEHVSIALSHSQSQSQANNSLRSSNSNSGSCSSNGGSCSSGSTTSDAMLARSMPQDIAHHHQIADTITADLSEPDIPHQGSVTLLPSEEASKSDNPSSSKLQIGRGSSSAVNPVPPRSSAITIGQQNVGVDHQHSYPRMDKEESVAGGELLECVADCAGGEMHDDQNEAVFSPSSMDDERMKIIEKASFFSSMP